MICNRFCHPFHGFQLPFYSYEGFRTPRYRVECFTASLWVCRPFHGL